MNKCSTQDVLKRVYADDTPQLSDLTYLLGLTDPEQIAQLFDFADNVRAKHVGDDILLRGIVEFSSHCSQNCYYCGLNKNNDDLERYSLTADEVIQATAKIAEDGIKTVVLQSGQVDQLDPTWLKDLIEEIKQKFDMAVTLSVGEKQHSDYEMWKNAGADRYLLKIETTDRGLYESMHPSMSYDNRLRCLSDLAELDYQVGSGTLVGLKNQTLESLAKDILFYKAQNIDMLGIGLFIPHAGSPMANEPAGSFQLTLKMLAVTRIVTKNTHLPATTALGSLGDGDGRIEALKVGANVLMPNYTPTPYRKLYEIYPGKRCVDEQAGCCVGCMKMMAAGLNRKLSFKRGDSLKFNQRLAC